MPYPSWQNTSAAHVDPTGVSSPSPSWTKSPVHGLVLRVFPPPPPPPPPPLHPHPHPPSLLCSSTPTLHTILLPILKSLQVPRAARSTSFTLPSSQPSPSMSETQPGEQPPTTHPTSAVVDPAQFFSVIDAFTQPKVTYNPASKTFIQPALKPS